jgi:integrase
MMDSQQVRRRVRYQNGTLERVSRKRGPDIWTYRWMERGSGKRPRVTLGTVTELRTMQAVKLAADGHRLSANRDNDYVSRITMAGLLGRYERECVTPFCEVPLGGMDNRTPSVHCARSYRSIIRKWLHHWDASLVTDFFEPHMVGKVEDWFAQLLHETPEHKALSPRSLRAIHGVLGQVFHSAQKWGYIERNPIDMIDLPKRMPKRKKKPRALTPAEYLGLVKLYGSLERAAIEVAGWLGPRRSEGFGLQWGDLNFEKKAVKFQRGIVHGRITPLKNESSHEELNLPEDVVEALLNWRRVTPYRQPSDWVFASPKTKGQRPYWPDAMLTKKIRPIAEKAGFGQIGWHTFRHSFVSWGKAVLKLEETKELARHENLKTTSEHYAGLSLDAKRDAQDRLVEFVKSEAAKAAEQVSLAEMPAATEAVQ